MNPADENKLKLPRAAAAGTVGDDENNGQIIEQQDHPMSDDEEAVR